MILLETDTDLTQPVYLCTISPYFCKSCYNVGLFLVLRTFLTYHASSWMTVALHSYYLNDILSVLA